MSPNWIIFSVFSVVGIIYVVCFLLILGKNNFVSAGRFPIPPHPTMDDVKRLARAGQKIDAVKCYRKIHDVGLVEAKNAVEGIPPAG